MRKNKEEDEGNERRDNSSIDLFFDRQPAFITLLRFPIRAVL